MTVILFGIENCEKNIGARDKIKIDKKTVLANEDNLLIILKRSVCGANSAIVELILPTVRSFYALVKYT